jgi:hypothetical protein
MIYALIVLWVLGGIQDYKLHCTEYPISSKEVSMIEHIIMGAFWPATVVIKFFYK